MHYRFKSFINKIQPVKNKNPENPFCTDLILTNSPSFFRNYCLIETGLSDRHKVIFSVSKAILQNSKPSIVH